MAQDTNNTTNANANHTEPRDPDLSDIRVRRHSPAVGSRDVFLDLKTRLSAQLRRQRDPRVDFADRSQVRPFVHDRLDALLDAQGIVLNRNEKRQLLEAIVTDLLDSQP